GVVHGLIGHTSAHGAVADHRDHIVLFAGKGARDRYAECYGDRCRGVSGARRVLLALSALADAGQAPSLTQRTNAIAPASQDLVRIRLMADVPEHPIVRRIEHMVERNGKLDHAEARAEMTSGHRNRINGLLAQFRRELRKLMVLERAQILRRLDAVKQRHRIFGAHLTWLRNAGNYATDHRKAPLSARGISCNSP